MSSSSLSSSLTVNVDSASRPQPRLPLMPARTKYVGPDASLRTIYRNILKACARHPDRYVGYVHIESSPRPRLRRPVSPSTALTPVLIIRRCSGSGTLVAGEASSEAGPSRI